MRNKFIVFTLTLAMVLSAFNGVFALSDSSEKVTVIVEVAGDAVLEAENAQRMGFKLFSETDEASRLERNIKTVQSSVRSDIEKNIDDNADFGFVYTHVFNGFSMDIDPDDIEKIKALPNVQNVYLSHVNKLYEEPSPSRAYIANCCEMMHTDFMHDNGYTGKGMVIAIVDVGFDVNHENFKGKTEGAKLSKVDIAEKIESGNLSSIAKNAHVTANRVYRSEKIPYAFNYYAKNSDTYDPTGTHGLHVAGIAAGNNGTDPEGNKFVGTAPDAQLLLMGCGVGENIYEAAELAAIDDAVKLGADVINASFGGDYNEANSAEKVAINNAVKAGVIFSTAEGNAARGYDEEDPDAALIDYSSGGTPAGFSGTIAVANAENTKVWEFYNEMNVGGETVRFYDANTKASFAQRFFDKEYEFEYAGTGTMDELKAVDVKGKIAVMDRSQDMTFAAKVSNATAADAVGVVFINTQEPFEINILQDSLKNIPTATVSVNDSYKFKEALTKIIKTDAEQKSGLVNHDGIEMSGSSSWGTNSTLELKPEITAPGGNVYSSVSDDKYENMTGTSMAAPHMTGAATLMIQCIRENPEKYKNVSDISRLVENLIMTSADVIMQNTEENIPYSPRLQGAGLVNLEKAVKTPVTLLGDTYYDGEYEIEKSKISLKEIGDSFTVNFTARNLSDTDVTYNSIKMTVITDDADENNVVSGMRKLTFEADIPDSVTVPAGGETEISIPVNLDKDELDENMETFINGFFVDGFVFLDNTENDAVPGISIPFMGFYGDWDSQKVLDKPYFSGESILGKTYLHSYSKRLSDGDFGFSDKERIMGSNWFVDENDEEYYEYCSEDYVGYSPNGDGEADLPQMRITPLRQPGKTDFIIYNSNGDEVVEKTDNGKKNARKFLPYFFTFTTDDMSLLPDGDYSCEVSTGFVGMDTYEKNESIRFKFYIDREKPVITKFEKSDDGTELTVAAKDNRQIMAFVLKCKMGGYEITEAYPIKALSEAEQTFDIEDLDEGSIEVEVIDYAQNTVSRSEKGLKFSFMKSYGTSLLFNAYNMTESDIKPTLILALFSEGKLVRCYSKNDVLPVGKSIYTFNINASNYDTMKLFVWDSMDNMKPLIEKSVFSPK